MFTVREWLDRVVQFPARRRLTDTDQPDVKQVDREEGIVIVEGDKINAAALNNLEARIDNAFKAIFHVGSYWFSADPASPADVLGFGTWIRVKGKMLIGVDESVAAFNSPGNTGGSQTHTLAEGNLPSHRHTIPALSGSAASAGAHTHTSAAHVHGFSGTTGNGGNHIHSFRSRVDGTTVGVSIGLDTGIYGTYFGASLSSSSEGAYKLAVADPINVGDHAHSYSGSTASATPAATGSSGAHTHTITTTANNTGYLGSGTAVNHMNPYEVAFIWRRTA